MSLLTNRFVRRYWATAILTLILIASSLLKFNHLGHRQITYWDESFHTLAAHNLLKHPLKFTLIDQPWLPYDYKNWGGNHVWLHKPPFSMWAIALFFWAFGVNALALRLPSLLLSGGAVIWTYLIGKELSDRRAGLIAAFWAAFNPCTYQLVHGYLFSDHVDIALLFWVCASSYWLVRGLQTGRLRYHGLCGVAQGFGYLSKSYLGFLALGIWLAMWFLTRVRFLSQDEIHISYRHLLVQIAAILGMVTPWLTYAFIKYPREFIHENWHVLAHLNSDIESWGATWDRPLFDYMVAVVPVIYTGVLAATLLLAICIIRRRSWQDTFIVLWVVGVVVPHSLAQTKTPSATLIVMPALVLALAVVISRGFASREYAGFWLAAGAVLLTFPGGVSLIAGRDDFDDLTSAVPYLTTNQWILQRVFGILAIAGFFALLVWLLRRCSSHRFVHWGIVIVAICLMVPLGVRSYQESREVTETNRDDATLLTLGHVINEEFTQNACFFLDDAEGNHHELMFYSDRTVYWLGTRDLKADAAKTQASGGVPYLASRAERPEPIVLDHREVTGFRIYALAASPSSASE